MFWILFVTMPVLTLSASFCMALSSEFLLTHPNLLMHYIIFIESTHCSSIYLLCPVQSKLCKNCSRISKIMTLLVHSLHTLQPHCPILSVTYIFSQLDYELIYFFQFNLDTWTLKITRAWVQETCLRCPKFCFMPTQEVLWVLYFMQIPLILRDILQVMQAVQ